MQYARKIKKDNAKLNQLMSLNKQNNNKNYCIKVYIMLKEISNQQKITLQVKDMLLTTKFHRFLTGGCLTEILCLFSKTTYLYK